jgi:hypothetical protein
MDIASWSCSLAHSVNLYDDLAPVERSFSPGVDGVDVDADKDLADVFNKSTQRLST